jgi:hypothetical protein
MTAIVRRRSMILLPLLGLVLAAASLTRVAPARSSHARAVEEQDSVVPLARAHAHNDFQHERPLFDALAHGFTSVEADVWLVNGELLIGHERATSGLVGR